VAGAAQPVEQRLAGVEDRGGGRGIAWGKAEGLGDDRGDGGGGGRRGGPDRDRGDPVARARLDQDADGDRGLDPREAFREVGGAGERQPRDLDPRPARIVALGPQGGIEPSEIAQGAADEPEGVGRRQLAQPPELRGARDRLVQALVSRGDDLQGIGQHPFLGGRRRPERRRGSRRLGGDGEGRAEQGGTGARQRGARQEGWRAAGPAGREDAGRRTGSGRHRAPAGP
jgi:hypothetical protein